MAETIIALLVITILALMYILRQKTNALNNVSKGYSTALNILQDEHTDLRTSYEKLIKARETEAIKASNQQTETILKADKYMLDRNNIAQDLSESEKIVMDLTAQLTASEAKADSDFKEWKTAEEKRIRADAIKRSQFVNNGFEKENFAPLLSIYPHKDFRHLGDPIDFLVCVGAQAVREDKANEVSKIILMDIKTGNSQLNKVQRRIRDACWRGDVHFAVYNPDTNKTRYWPELKDKKK